MGLFDGALGALLKIKAASIAERGLAAKPWFHGTRSDVIPNATQPLWLAEDPKVAAAYTGGGRRGDAVKNAIKGGRIQPFVTKDTVQDTGNVVTENVPLDHDAWLESLGIRRPEEFRRLLTERAKEAARQSHITGSNWLPMWDDLGLVGGSREGGFSTAPYHRVPPQFQVLDRAPFREQIIETLGPEALLQFKHPSTSVEYSKGKLRPAGRVDNANVLWAPSPAHSVVNPFELRRGGLVALQGGTRGTT